MRKRHSIRPGIFHLRKPLPVSDERTIRTHWPIDRRIAEADCGNKHLGDKYATKIINHELVTAMGEVLYYEILSIYFARQPQQPQHKDRKDHVFQNFIISLYQNHRMEREVTYYAQEQYLTPRYFRQSSKRNRAFRPCSGSFAWSLPTPNRCSVPRT